MCLNCDCVITVYDDWINTGHLFFAMFPKPNMVLFSSTLVEGSVQTVCSHTDRKESEYSARVKDFSKTDQD